MLRSSEQRQKSAQFVKYASLVGLRISPYWGDLSVPTPNGCRIGKTATAWGTKAKPSVAAQAPAALLSIELRDISLLAITSREIEMS
jgi:hypothetical protein